MNVLFLILAPPLVALALCVHLGLAWAWLALPEELRECRGLLAPLVGCALLIVVAAPLTNVSALTAPQIAAGLALAALPLNAWVLLRQRCRGGEGERGRGAEGERGRGGEWSPVSPSPGLFVCLLGLFLFALAILPLLRWGASLPIGENWDAAEFYVPLGRALQLQSQRDLALLPPNPLVTILTTPPVSGRIHAFSYLHAAASRATGVDSLGSFAPMMAFVLALYPPAVFILARALGLGSRAGLLGAGLAALAWLPLWVAYNSFSNHLLALPLLPAALAAALVALRAGTTRALLSGALLAAALATAYYPALTAYVALLGPAVVWLWWGAGPRTEDEGRRTEDEGRRTEDEGRRTKDRGRRTEDGGRRTEDEGRRTKDEGRRTKAETLFSWSPVSRLVSLVSRLVSPGLLVSRSLVSRLPSLVSRLASLAVLAFALSGAAQYAFFVRDGFLGEVLRAPEGFGISGLVGLGDALGFEATLRGEGLPTDRRLLWPAAAAAVGLAGAALLGRRAPLLAALALGMGLYQGYTAVRDYDYGFYKGITFAQPVVALLVAAGVAALWQLAMGAPAARTFAGHAEQRIQMQPGIFSSMPRRPLVLALLAGGLALVVGLSAATTWRVQARYSAAGPRLWSQREAEIALVRAEVAPEASVLVVPPGGRPILNSLISYALLGRPMFGQFLTGYNSFDAPPGNQVPDLALLPDGADPRGYGYRADEVRWAGAGLRLYGRAPDVRFHRAFGEGGRYPALEPGATLALRLGDAGIALPGDETPGGAGQARLALGAASFEATTLEVVDAATSVPLPGGLVELVSPPLDLPAEVLVRNTGSATAFLWWGELRDPAASGAAQPRDQVFVQALPEQTGGPLVAATLRLHTLPLPAGRQKLTTLLTVSHAAPGGDWQEAGRWVFFPDGSAPLRLELDLERLALSISRAGEPFEAYGAAAAPGDGDYQVSLLLANDGQVVYATRLWSWSASDGVIGEVALDGVAFDAVPLPRPATALLAPSADGGLLLRGYTMPQRRLRPGAPAELSLVWQSQRRLSDDLQARLTLRDRRGQLLASAVAPIGAPEHGTSTWQEGELSEQRFALVVPPEARGRATLAVELIGPDGQVAPFEGAGAAQPLLEVEVVR